MYNIYAVDTLKPYNKFASGGPICHDATCVATAVAFVWIENTGRFVCGPTSYAAIYVHITMHLYIP